MRRNLLVQIGVALWCAMVLFLSGCATTRGLGQDVQSLGRGLENSAK